MSKEVDERIVKMEFQNKDFQENAEKTIKTLDELEQSLEFKSGISKSLDVVASNFTKMGVTAHRVIQNITDDVYNLGKNITKSLTVDQMFAGFNEYELKMGSTQTIMASTGESLDVVNQKLKELNDYSDKTIYSFRDMTSNIGKFTNAGVKLTPAVNAMKGIANLAAVSGANAEQASHAMYNFAQALSAGYVKLIDWKSIEIANMATVEFKEQLIETALKLKTIRKEGNKYISTTRDMKGQVSKAFDAESMFNESLSAQWLTTDVLTETLEKYASETTEIGKKANKAATEIKTFTMAIGALKESAATGWADTMEVIFGNYDEATKLWTELFKKIDGWLGKISEDRKKVLDAWKSFSGRDMMIEGINNVLDIVEALGTIISRSLNDLLAYNKGWRYLDSTLDTIDIGPVGNVMYESLVKSTAAFRDLTKALVPSERTISNLSDTLLGLLTILRDAWSIASVILGFTFKILKILSPLLKIVFAITGAIGRCIYTLSEFTRKLLNLGPAAKSFDEFLDGIYDKVNGWADKTVELIGNIPDALKRALDAINLIDLPDLSDIGKSLMEGLTNAIENFKDKGTLASFFEGFFNTESVKEAGRKIKELCSAIRQNVAQFVDNLKMELQSAGPAGEFLVNIFETIKNAISLAFSTIGKVLVNFANALGIATDKLSAFFEGFNVEQAIKLAQVISFIAVMIKFGKNLKTITALATEATNVLKSLKDTIKMFGGALKDIGKGLKMKLQAEAFKDIAFGLGVIVASIIALSAIDKDRLDDAVKVFMKITAVIALMVIVVSEFGATIKGLSGALSSSSTSIAHAVSKSMNTIAKGFSNAMVIAAIGASVGALAALLGSITAMMVALSAIDAAKLRVRVDILRDVFSMIMLLVLEIGAIMTAIVLIDRLVKKTDSGASSIIASSIALFALANAISTLIVPIMAFANMDTDKLKQGMIGMSAAVGIALVAFAGIAFMSAMSPNIAKNLGAVSVALGVFAASIMAMIVPIFLLGSMDPDRLSRGLWALAHIIGDLSMALIALGFAVKLMGKEASGKEALGLAVSFGILIGAVGILTTMAPKILSNINEITDAMTAVIGAVAHAITSSANEIVGAVLSLVDALLDSLYDYLPVILTDLSNILDSILVWLDGYLPGFMYKAVKIIGASLKEFTKSAKENINLMDLAIMIGTIASIMFFINQISKMSDKIKEATPGLLILSGVLVIVGTVLNELIESSDDSGAVAAAAVALKIGLDSIVNLAKKLPEITEAMKQVKLGRILKAVITTGIIVGALVGLFYLMQNMGIDGKMILAYGVGLGAVMYAMSYLIRAIKTNVRAAKDYSKKEIVATVAVIAEIAAIAAIIVGAIKWMSTSQLDWKSMLAYAGGLSLVFLSLTPMIMAMSYVGRKSRRLGSAAPVVGTVIKVIGVVAVIAALFAILASLKVDPKTMLMYSAILSLTFLSLVPLMKAMGQAQEAGSKMKRWRQFLGQTIVIASVMASLLGVFVVLDKAKIDPMKMVGYTAAMSLVFLAMPPMLKAMGQMAEGAKETEKFSSFGGLAVDIIAIIASLLGIFVALDKAKINPRDMVTRAIALGIAFAALNPMLAGLGKAAEGAKDTKFTAFLGLLVDLVPVIAALMGVFIALDKLKVDPLKMTDYSVGLAIAFVGLSPMLLAIGKASQWNYGTIKASALLALAAVIGAAGIVVGGALAAMSAINADPTKVMEYAKAFSLALLAMTPIILVVGLLQALFSKIQADPATMMTTGLSVIAVVSAIVLIMTGIIGLLGALNFNGALGESLGKGTEVLVEIANGLGSFVGTLVGAGIGSGLGSFANAAKPFFDMVSNLPDDFGDKMGALATGLLTLSGAALIEQIGNLFNLFSDNKDSSLKKLGQDLNDFAPEMVKLSESLEGITPEQATVMKYAGEGLKAIVDAMPKEDGWMQKIFGTTTDMGTFATNLTSLGGAIADFTGKVAGVEEGDVNHAVACAKIINTINDELPLTGGWKQMVEGFPDMGTFATNVTSLGDGIANFNNAITDADGKSILNQTAIESATAALNGIAGVTKNVEDNKGFWTILSGFPDMSVFAKNVEDLGDGLGKFADKTKDVDKTKAADAVEVLNSIAQIRMYLENATIKEKDAKKFATGIEKVAYGLGEIIGNLKDIKETEGTPLSSLNDVLNTIITMKGNLVNATIGEDEVIAFETGADTLADGIDSIIDTVKGLKDAETTIDSTSLITRVEEMKKTIIDKLSFNPNNQFSEEWQAGANLTLGFSNGMTDQYAIQELKNSAQIVVDYAIEKIQEAADEHSPSKRAEKDGANLTKGYANGIKKDLSPIKTSAKLLVNEAFNAMSDALTKAYRLMNENEGFEPVIAPVVDLSNARRSASELNNLFASANANVGADAIPTKAIKISRAVKIETDAQRSSTDLTKVIDNVKRIGEKLTGMESKMESLKVVLDSGELVGGMTPKLMRALKKQQTNISRGVISSVVR